MKAEDATWTYVSSRLIEESSESNKQPHTEHFDKSAKPQLATIRTDTDSCKRCGIPGHIAADCRKPWDRIKDRRKGNNGNRTKIEWNEKGKPKARLAFISASRTDPSSSEKITIDSGASEHIVHPKNFFLSLSNMATISIKVADGRQFTATQKGTVAVQLHTDDGQEASPVILRFVYYLPCLEMSVLSVTKLVQSGISVMFMQEKVDFIDLIADNKTLGCGFRSISSSLYEVTVSMPQKEGKVFVCTKLRPQSSTSHILWHIRLGHIGKRPFEMMKDGAVEGITDIKSCSIDCHVSAEANMTRQPSRGSLIMGKQEHTIHCDIIGPFRYPTAGRAKYILSIVVGNFASDVRSYLLRVMKHKNTSLSLLLGSKESQALRFNSYTLTTPKNSYLVSIALQLWVSTFKLLLDTRHSQMVSLSGSIVLFLLGLNRFLSSRNYLYPTGARLYCMQPIFTILLLPLLSTDRPLTKHCSAGVRMSHSCAYFDV